MRLLPSFLALALAAGAVCPATAQTMKPGLWEIQNKMNDPRMNDAMAEMQKQLAAMPPEQRKQMEAMMANQGVKLAPGAQGMTVQVCMTKEQVERNEMPMDSKSDCKVTSQSRSGNTTKMAFACANPPSSGEGQFTVTGPDAYSSKMTVKTVVNGKPETTQMEGAGKWLGADCGAVRPLAAPKR